MMALKDYDLRGILVEEPAHTGNFLKKKLEVNESYFGRRQKGKNLKGIRLLCLDASNEMVRYQLVS
jgi:hypothetical protein